MRLTKKTTIGYFHKLFGDSSIYTKEQLISDLDDIVQKLGQLEDIEEELGIDLVVLLKALILNEEIFYKDSNGNINSTENEISLNMDSDGLCLHISNIGYFYTKDYGKTWALTKEELL